jgi:hypothetical protein
MKTRRQKTRSSQPAQPRYALRRGLGFWELTFEGHPAIFKHELGALYVASLLLEPPEAPLHAVDLMVKARRRGGEAVDEAELIQQRNLGRDDAEAVRNLRQRARELEAVLDQKRASEAVKAEARRELQEITEFLRKNSWRSQDNAQKCVRAVARAIQRLHSHLAGAVDAHGKPHPVLQGFARHLDQYLLTPSGRGGSRGGPRSLSAPGGCFAYEPPAGVVWG